ncbi:MAG: potassium channel family protein [Thermodesulfobacteriota bacterium]
MTFFIRTIPPARLSRNNFILLVCLLILILFYPVFSGGKEFLRGVILTGIVLASIFSLNFSARTRKILVATGGTTLVLLWISVFFHSRIWVLLAFINMFFYQIFILFFMIRHIGRGRQVNGTIILNAVNGYLIIGLLGSLLLAMGEIAEWLFLGIETPLISIAGEASPQFHDYLYFSFVTVTTLGYGDITPANELAKSIVFLLAVSGQLYLTILVAMLVGKYLSRAKE